MKQVIVLFTGLLFFSSCKKSDEQKIVDNLRGYWTLNYQDINGYVDTQLQGCTWYFRNCPYSADDWCSSVVNCSNPLMDYEIRYRLADGGKSMEFWDAVGSTYETREILVLSKHEFVLRNSNSQQGVITEYYVR